MAIASAAEAMSTGQMLLCAANTLFDKVDAEMLALREAVAESGPGSLQWARLGLVRGAAEVASAAFSPTAGVWESLQMTLFISKLHLLRDFFSICLAAGRAFQAEVAPGASLPTGDSLIKPVKKYVTDFLGLMLLGAGPRHLASCVAHLVKGASEGAVETFLDQRKGKERLDLEEMVQALLEEKLSNGSLNQARVAKASNLATKLGSAVAKWELFLQLDQVSSVKAPELWSVNPSDSNFMKTPPTQAVEMLQAAKQVNGLQHAGVQVTSMGGKYRRCYHASGKWGPKSLLNFKTWL